MQTYRRLKGFSTWHWHRNCSSWPNANFVEENRVQKPEEGNGRLCRECSVWESLDVKERRKDENTNN